MSAPDESLVYAVRHVFLPPKLPGSHDGTRFATTDRLLLQRVLEALDRFGSCSDPANDENIRAVHLVIQRMISLLNDEGHVDERILLKALAELPSQGGALPLYLQAQNAAIIVRKEDGDRVFFEALELTPSNDAIMSTKGRLKRCFPGPAVAVPVVTFNSSEFQSTVAKTLAKLSYQEAQEMQPMARKAGQDHSEHRDTTSPQLITEFFISFLNSVGPQVCVPKIWKNTREEVAWSKGNLLPWHRSPVWFLARVVIQTTFSRLHSARDYYKEFMVFFMAKLTHQAISHRMPCDLLHCMTSKISRRLSKLGSRRGQNWLAFVERILESATRHLQAAWEMVVASESDLQMQALAKLDFKKDCVLQLSALDDYVKFVTQLPPIDTPVQTFSPPPVTTTFPRNSLPDLPTSTTTDIFYVLAALEDWVSSHLPAWLRIHISDPATCGQLQCLTKRYHGFASAHYHGNPESISLMLLTCLELWIACDKSATGQHPLMRDYSPEVPVPLLHSLILPLKIQMERLSLAEAYLEKRASQANGTYPSLFSNFGHPESFAVRYYATSQKHQVLLRSVEEWAHEKREQKKSELADAKKEYRRLMDLYAASQCNTTTQRVRGRGRRRHFEECPEYHDPDRCSRCLYKTQALSMAIELDEWPLPQRELDAQATVFELDCPQAFNDWRDATMFLIMDILKSEYHNATGCHNPYDPSCCLSRFVGTSPQRLRLISQVKPVVGASHYTKKQVAVATEASILVNNGLRYMYFDMKAGRFTTSVNETEKIPEMCTYQVRDCKPLQQFIYRPHFRSDGPQHNVVISSQHACPHDMSLEEFKSLATVPLGAHLQWRNILQQLSLPSIDFSQMTTTLVLLQVIRQAGPPSAEGIARVGHQDLCDEAFGQQLFHALDGALVRIRENWESRHALEIFIAISSRLLSLTESDQVVRQSRTFLRRCRQVALGWTDNLRSMARETTDPNQRDELLRRGFEIALVCATTFDVDHPRLADELQIPSECAIFIGCSIIIHENSHVAMVPTNMLQRMSFQRWQRLSHSALPLLLVELTTGWSAGIDLAMGRCWSGYRPGRSGWRSQPRNAPHWLMTTTPAGAGTASQTVQYSLLSGELRVDGLPLSRLPQEFEQHAMYKVLFDRSAVGVMRANMPGMEFSTMRPFRGYEISFAMHKFPGERSPPLAGLDLVLTCAKDDQSYSLLPPWLFDGELPHRLVKDYVHWYHANTQSVEFRPINDPWTSSEDHWLLSKADEGWSMTKGNDVFLAGMASTTGKAISNLLAPVESAIHIHLVFRPSHAHLEVELPRLQIDFVLAEGTKLLKSRQFRGMYLDASPRIQTLVGLKSKVVLTNNNKDRLVLVPDGTVSWRPTASHIHVHVAVGSSTKVYPFELDTRLGRILDNGTLESKLALSYLHALTSFCVPDGLTGKTGTEQALEILNSAAVRSFDHLSEENIECLHNIAKLTPCRTYYPSHLRVMQSIDWVSGLCPLYQDGQLYTSVVSLLDHAKSLEFFHSSKQQSKKEVGRGAKFLIERDLIRSSVFRSSEFGAEHYTTSHDRIYDTLEQHSIQASADGTYDSAKSMWDARLSRANGGRASSAGCDPAMRAASRVFQALCSRESASLEDNPLAKEIWRLIVKYEDCAVWQTACVPASLPDNLVGYDAERLTDAKGFLAVHWCQLHRTLSGGQHNKFSIMMLLATLAYAKGISFSVVEVLVAFFNVPEIGGIQTPGAVSYFELTKGTCLDLIKLRSALENSSKEFDECPEYRLARLPSESVQAARDRRSNAWQLKKDGLITSILEDFKRQWPCEILQKPAIQGMDTYIDVDSALAATKSHVKTWRDNLRFFRYLCQIATAVDRLPVQPLPGSTISVSLPLPLPGPPRKRAWLRTSDMLSGQAPSLAAPPPSLPPNLTTSIDVDAAVTKRLMDMIARLRSQADRRHEKEYVQDLQESSKGLQAQDSRADVASSVGDIGTLLEKHLRLCQEYVARLYGLLVDGLSYTRHIPSGGVAAKYNSPRVTSAFFLKQLAGAQWAGVSALWRGAIVAYGVALTVLQRAVRLLALRDNRADLVKELLNPGHENWNPLDSPESLLIEVESGILVRKVQAEIAEQMKHPAGNRNAVMQLNMGEGKSSVIVPITAAAMADGLRLVRVVVAKPQSKQMFQMLVSKLGGLCNRRIYHMPFSRSLKLGLAEVNTISGTYQECMKTGGILLVQPEHILSFQLMGVETNLSGDDKAEVSRSLLSTQHFFNSHSRDIVDESDENFSVKFELVYTMGTQRPIDLSPGRWYLIQTVLRLIRKLVPRIHGELPSSVELEQGPAGSFSRTRLLRHDAQNLLCCRLAREICASGLQDVPIGRQSKKVRKAVFKYISEPELRPKEISAVEGRADFWTDSIKQHLLLLRGLIAGGVLAFAFGQKRWRVNYGLAPTRRPETRLAVPYRAKDSPALRSEFSHPDVVIVLTCLSYYYGGLEDHDLFTTFEHLVKSDQADNEYQEWVQDAPSLPEAFRTLTGINLKDRHQCTRDIFPHLRQSQAVIDFFLARIIFPQGMREFPQKLSASGWDLGKSKPNPTTGFSGTNDSKHLLPLTVQHLDLDEQRHTNALVLLHLLQPENTVEMMPPSSGKECADAVRLLQLVINLDRPAQVILDVGAQVIELSNIQVAKEWLKMTAAQPDKEAVVFFDDGDNIMVCNRAGNIEAFQTSPYSKQLDLCYVFLDEAHTRGTDLKLPQDYRAVVTLGAGLTKDRLVQACMRMRKLGKGQSVVFCVTEEIRVKILGVTGRAATASIDVSDVLMWSVNETYTDLRRSMPLWAAQGTRFERQRLIWDNCTADSGITLSESEAEKFLEQEALSLEDRYQPRDDAAEADALFNGSDSNPSLAQIRHRCELFDSTKFTAAALQEEQERELAPEIQAERQIERPEPAEPMPMSVHKHVEMFVETGQLTHPGPAFKPAFQSLARISAAARFSLDQLPADLLVTTDFAVTVRLQGKDAHADAYQRAVQWILTTTREPVRMVIISPYEANALLPRIKLSAAVHLHLYAPRTNLAYAPLDDLRLSVAPPLSDDWTPPWHLVLQLNLFAGQLYFGSYDEYKDACDMLGYAWKVMDGEDMDIDMVVQADGFIVRGDGKESPTKFLQTLLAAVRRDGRDIGKVHWGRMLGGEMLGVEEFEDRRDGQEDEDMQDV